MRTRLLTLSTKLEIIVDIVNFAPLSQVRIDPKAVAHEQKISARPA